MREGEFIRVKGEKRTKGWEISVGETIERRREANCRYKKGITPWPLPYSLSRIPLKTGAHCVVVTYEPMSKFIPLYGPQSYRRMYRASRTRRSCLSAYLFLLSIVHKMFGPSILLLHRSICCVRPEWLHFSVAAALMCSLCRVLKLLAVSPMYVFLQGLHSYL